MKYRYDSMLYLSLLFLLCGLKSFSLQWTANEYSIAGKVPSLELIKLNVTPQILCNYDRLSVSWSVTTSFPNFEYLGRVALMVHSHPSKTALATSLSTTVDVRQYHHKQNILGIGCLLAKPLCIPSTKNMVLNPFDNTIAVEFDQDTNSPILDTLPLLLNAFEFIPEINGSNTFANWVNNRKLLISLSDSDMQRVWAAYNNSDPVKLFVKDYRDVNDLSKLKGNIIFHPAHHGISQLFAVDSKTGDIISEIKSIEVETCENHDILPSPKFSDTRKSELQSKFHIKGVVPTSGFEAIKVNPAVVPELKSGSWAISFWIRLLEGPTGSFRTLIYKGATQDLMQRTPSAWLLPDSNRITIRVSTDQNPDEAIISNQELPVDEWTFITMQFKNYTQEALDLTPSQQITIDSPKGRWSSINEAVEYSYGMELYFNGLLDISARFKRPVLGNDGTMLLFKDPSFQGPKSFVHDLIVWKATMTAQEVLSLYVAGPKKLIIQPVNDILSILKRSSSLFLPYIAQTQAQIHDFSDPAVLPAEVSVTGDTAESQKVDVHPESTQGGTNQDRIIAFMNKKSQESITNCEDYYTRLDIHAESAEMGSLEAFIHWAKLLVYGYEISTSKCGFSLIKQPTTFAKSFYEVHEDDFGTEEKKNVAMSIKEIPVLFQDVARANVAFVTGVDRGYVPALMPLAMHLLLGVGLEPLLQANRSLHADWGLPFPFTKSSSPSSSSTPLGNSFHAHLQSYLAKALPNCHSRHQNISPSSSYLEDVELIGIPTLCSIPPSPSSPSHNRNQSLPDEPHVTHLVNGLFYMAALWNDPEAHALLSYRYEHGIGGIVKDTETALQYAILPARKSHEAYFAVGAQPVVEADRLHENTIAEVSKGQQGNDDELIQYQRLRAQEGDVAAMVAMGDLYYYGARGLPRDQVQALNYFTQAAALGDPSGMCGAANMWLKGEGTKMNATKAIALYEEAAQNGSIRAYNGLGYLYFYGTEQVPRNASLAFQYFLMAAQYETDGDALFNTAYCYEHGIGTNTSLPQAIHYYQLAAKKVGYFGAVYRLGELSLEGIGLPRSNEQALMYFKAVNGVSPWMGWLRRGFDLFLSSQSAATTTSATSRHFLNFFFSSSSSSSSTTSSSPVVLQHHHLHAMKSLWCYLYAGEFGFEVAQSNAAYILRSLLLPTLASPTATTGQASSVTTVTPMTLYQQQQQTVLQQVLQREYLLSGFVHFQGEAHFYLGNHYWLTASPPNPTAAMYYYQLASHGGKETLATAYLGMLHHFHWLDGPTDHTNERRRALRYYEEALQAKEFTSTNLYYVVKVLHWSLQARHSYMLLDPLLSLVESSIRNMWK